MVGTAQDLEPRRDNCSIRFPRVISQEDVTAAHNEKTKVRNPRKQFYRDTEYRLMNPQPPLGKIPHSLLPTNHRTRVPYFIFTAISTTTAVEKRVQNLARFQTASQDLLKGQVVYKLNWNYRKKASVLPVGAGTTHPRVLQAGQFILFLSHEQPYL